MTSTSISSLCSDEGSCFSISLGRPSSTHPCTRQLLPTEKTRRRPAAVRSSLAATGLSFPSQICCRTRKASHADGPY
uniref:Uncharacterized protein n=1 Tax=Steinernema glaseri TaxID=37863 RepID=A0A1I7ZRP9_9BILA